MFKPKERFSKRERIMSKKEKNELIRIVHHLRELNLNYFPIVWKDKKDKSDMVKIGGKDHPAKFHKNDKVVWRGLNYIVELTVGPYQNSPHLKEEYRDWGYGLRKQFGKEVEVVIDESELLTVDTAKQFGLVEVKK